MIIAIYVVISIICGVALTLTGMVKDSETTKSYCREWHFWLAIIVFALLWPMFLLQLITLLIGRFLRRIGL